MFQLDVFPMRKAQKEGNSTLKNTGGPSSERNNTIAACWWVVAVCCCSSQDSGCGTKNITQKKCVYIYTYLYIYIYIYLEDLLYFTGRWLFPLLSTSYLMRSGQNYEIIGGRNQKTMKARKAWLWLLPLLRKPIPPLTAKNSLDPSPELILLFLPDHVPHRWGR